MSLRIPIRVSWGDCARRSLLAASHRFSAEKAVLRPRRSSGKRRVKHGEVLPCVCILMIGKHDYYCNPIDCQANHTERKTRSLNILYRYSFSRQRSIQNARSYRKTQKNGQTQVPKAILWWTYVVSESNHPSLWLVAPSMLPFFPSSHFAPWKSSMCFTYDTQTIHFPFHICHGVPWKSNKR